MRLRESHSGHNHPMNNAAVSSRWATSRSSSHHGPRARRPAHDGDSEQCPAQAPSGQRRRQQSVEQRSAGTITPPRSPTTTTTSRTIGPPARRSHGGDHAKRRTARRSRTPPLATTTTRQGVVSTSAATLSSCAVSKPPSSTSPGRAWRSCTARPRAPSSRAAVTRFLGSAVGVRRHPEPERHQDVDGPVVVVPSAAARMVGHLDLDVRRLIRLDHHRRHHLGVRAEVVRSSSR